MTTHAAIRVNNDFSTGQAGITAGTADDKTAGRVDVDFGFIIQQAGLVEYYIDDFFCQKVDEMFPIGFGCVLVTDDHRVDVHRLSVLIEQRYLAFCIGAKKWGISGLAKPACFHQQLMSPHDRGGHEFFCFVASEAEHHTLVSCSLLTEEGRIGIHPHGDVGRLRIGQVDDLQSLIVESASFFGIADLLDGFPDDSFNVQCGVGGNLSAYNYDIGSGKDLAGNPAFGVLTKTCVENGIGNLIADFVRMSFAY